jgi:tRNA 2-selenouridine synthase
MTSSQESSKNGAAPDSRFDPSMGIESLAGTFHPHAIEVQDFAYYARVIDLRPRAEYEDDHIPGALNIEAPAQLPAGMPATSDVLAPIAAEEPGIARSWPALAAALAGVRLDEAILVYCGRGGLVSTPVARALRWRGWTVDVLGGGWINYRRWVQAGLEVLPRLVPFRIIACSLGSESARVLDALSGASQQVLDLEALALHRRLAFSPSGSAQPAQPWFESQLLSKLRTFDPRRPVWVADVGSSLGAVALPGALLDALSIAPMARLEAPLDARVDAWMLDEALCADPPALLKQVCAMEPSPAAEVVNRWQQMSAIGQVRQLLASILGEFLDRAYAMDRAARDARRHALRPFVADTLLTDGLAAAAADCLRRREPPDPVPT